MSVFTSFPKVQSYTNTDFYSMTIILFYLKRTIGLKSMIRF